MKFNNFAKAQALFNLFKVSARYMPFLESLELDELKKDVDRYEVLQSLDGRVFKDAYPLYKEKNQLDELAKICPKSFAAFGANLPTADEENGLKEAYDCYYALRLIQKIDKKAAKKIDYDAPSEEFLQKFAKSGYNFKINNDKNNSFVEIYKDDTFIKKYYMNSLDSKTLYLSSLKDLWAKCHLLLEGKKYPQLNYLETGLRLLKKFEEDRNKLIKDTAKYQKMGIDLGPRSDLYAGLYLNKDLGYEKVQTAAFALLAAELQFSILAAELNYPIEVQIRNGGGSTGRKLKYLDGVRYDLREEDTSLSLSLKTPSLDAAKEINFAKIKDIFKDFVEYNTLGINDRRFFKDSEPSTPTFKKVYMNYKDHNEFTPEEMKARGATKTM